MICSVCYHLSSDSEEKGNTGYSRWECGACALRNLFPLIVMKDSGGAAACCIIFCTNDHIQVTSVNML